MHILVVNTRTMELEPYYLQKGEFLYFKKKKLLLFWRQINEKNIFAELGLKTLPLLCALVLGQSLVATKVLFFSWGKNPHEEVFLRNI